MNYDDGDTAEVEEKLKQPTQEKTLRDNLDALFFSAADAQNFYSVHALTEKAIELVNTDICEKINNLLRKWTVLTESLPMSEFNNGRLAALINCIKDLKELQ